MKIIDLLNKIANGEVKDKTKFRIYFNNGLYRDFYYDKQEQEELNSLKNVSDNYSLYDEISLNDEVEILEEEKKIPEKLDKYADISGDLACEWSFAEKKLKDKVNEIIDYLDYLKSKGDE